MKKLVIFILLLLISRLMFAQVGINTDGSQPDPSAGLDIKFSDKGILIPRMTIEERNSISSPAEGLMIFCTNCGTKGSLSIYSAGAWQTYSPCTIISPTEDVHKVIPGQIIWKWNSVSEAVGYKWNTSDNIDLATDLGNQLSKTEMIYDCDTIFTRYVWTYNICGVSPVTILSQSIPDGIPDAPTAGTHEAWELHMIWNWNTVSGATGYMWNTENDIETAIDMGINTTKLETGLICETEYTRYLWSYNGCGYSNPTVLNYFTTDCCGDSFTVNHLVSGGVAPVDKMVTYGTVNNIPGALNICWITSNLGADHQATSVDDATEASAGWYWQFNRMQGFKHNGTTVTPTMTITYNDENSNWIPANDPCAIELGSHWRIPTWTEWQNISTSGNWTTGIDPWNSNLKMHLAGYIVSPSTLYDRGVYGMYWTSTQVNDENYYHDAYHLCFDLPYFYYCANSKASGQSLRCLREP